MSPGLSASRALLFPGPQPPVSHFGLTLLRHVVASGLRYSLYQLGLPLPEAPPVVIVRLRLYLDAAGVRKLLHGSRGGTRTALALLEPGRQKAFGEADQRLAAAAFVHRLRLRLQLLSEARAVPPAGESWGAFRRALSGLLPRLNAAFLSEVLAVLRRFRERERGRETPPCLGPAAARAATGREVDLSCLGPPDPFLPDWSATPDTARKMAGGAARDAGVATGRGVFREEYRRALSALAPRYRGLARRAVARGLLQEEEQAFFIPFDLAADLDTDRPLGWVEAAVASNYREYQSAWSAQPPPDLLFADSPFIEGPGAPPEFDEAVLWPLA